MAGWLAEPWGEALLKVSDIRSRDRERVHELRFLKGLDLGRQRAQLLDDARALLQRLLAGSLDVDEFAQACPLPGRLARTQVARKGRWAARSWR
jgi:hypothetical protein